jgi:N-methylhydantoinase A
MSADVKSDYIKTLHQRLSQMTVGELAAECAALGARARAWLEQDAPAVSASRIAYSADLRYLGQAFQIEVPIDPAWLKAPDLDDLVEAFHQLHERLYAHADRAADVELIDLRATITGTTPKPQLHRPARGEGPAAPYSRRRIHYDRRSYEAAIYHRRDLLAGQYFDGPAVVEQDDTTTLVPDGFRGEVDGLGNIVIREHDA